METPLTVGECQQIYDKYNLGISEHTKETTLLCQIIKRLESGPVEPEVSQPSELLPCPFCGGNDCVQSSEEGFPIVPKCLYSAKSFKELLDKWNKRVG